MKRNAFVLLLVLGLVAALPAWGGDPHCKKVGGVLMTNIAAIDGTYNLGPVFGDLAGSVAAKILPTPDPTGGFWLQHYWVTFSGETIKFNPAHLKPTGTDTEGVVAVKWGDYESDIVPGGTGKYANANGKVWYFGLADFGANTLVLRYRGYVCFEGAGDED